MCRLRRVDRDRSLKKIGIPFLAARTLKIAEAAVVSVVLKILQHLSSSTEICKERMPLGSTHFWYAE